MEYCESILEAVKRTPMVRLRRSTEGLRPLILAKLEFLHPGGSIKDRIAQRLIAEAERSGLLKPGGTIVEPTSGNTGHALAIVAAVRGYRMIFVVPDKTSDEKIALLRAYGAEVVRTPAGVSHDSAESCYRVAARLAAEIPGAFSPNQYANPANPAAHEATTGPEIWEQTGGRVGVVVCGMGTGGTISGIARALKQRSAGVQVVGADPDGSIYSGMVHPYEVEGIGKNFFPSTLDMTLVDRVVTVGDTDSFAATRRLARDEGLLVGGSSGTAFHAATVVARELGPDDVVVVVLPDTGRNYISKVFNDSWLAQVAARSAHRARVSEPAALLRDILQSRPHHAGELVTVARTAQLRDAVMLMREHGISHLPVRTDGDTASALVGSVRETTLLPRLLRDPALAPTPVESVMEAPLAHAAPDTPVLDVAGRLSDGETALLVVEAGRTLGIVTRGDVLRHLAVGRG